MAVGTVEYNQSLSGNIIQTINGSQIKFLKSGRYKMHFNLTSNNTNNNLLFYIGNPTPTLRFVSTTASTSGIVCSYVGIIDIVANEFMVVQTSFPGTAYYNCSYFIEYIDESSNVVNQITNTGNVTFSSIPTTIDFYKSYTTNNGFTSWPPPIANLNGLQVPYQWLIDTQAKYIQNYSMCTSLTKITNYVGQITKSGHY